MADTMAYVVGWGRDGFGPTGIKKLKYALMPLISKRECVSYWRVDYRNICTEPGLGKNACQVNLEINFARKKTIRIYRFTEICAH